jgi:hypothetical protein
MSKKLWLCTVAALCLVAASASANSFVSMSKTVKTGGQGESNKAMLDCSGQIEVALNNTYSGDNTSAPNNVTTYGCSGWNESGGEVVYHLFLASPSMWHADLTPSGCDLDLAVLDACDETAGCLIVVDSGVITNQPVQGDFWLVVDGYGGARCAYTLTLTEDPLPQPVDFCEYVTSLTCADQDLNGDTTTGQNLLTSQMSGCTGYTESGNENYYAITLFPSGSFTATVGFATADAAIYVLDACVEPFTCLVGADDTLSGEAETLTYSNTGTEMQTVYLVIDSYSGYGAYTGTLICDPGTVSVEMRSWGAVKAVYR